MTENKTCPTHHLELLFKPEGISKKGNRYNAFWACPNRDCKYTENIEEKQGHFLSMQAEFRRSKEIAYFSCTNAAVEIMRGERIDELKGDLLIRGIITWRNFFYQEWEKWYKREIMEINEE